MRLKLVIVLVALAVLSALSATAASTEVSCRGGRTWAANDAVRVYATGKQLPRRVWRTTVYACTSAKRTLLASWSSYRGGEQSARLIEGLSAVRVAGGMVAYRLSFVPYEPRMGTAHQLVVRNARTGKVLLRQATGGVGRRRRPRPTLRKRRAAPRRAARPAARPPRAT